MEDPRDIRLPTHTLGLRRINEARTIAQRRLNFSRKGRFNSDGSIKVLGEYNLGQKGGTYTDKEPMMVIRPGRESTPPSFTGLTPNRSHPGTLSAEQFFVTIRRLCEDLSKQQRHALFVQFRAYPIKRNGTLDESPVSAPTPTPKIRTVSTQIGRLSGDERARLFNEFHFRIKQGPTQQPKTQSGSRQQSRARTAAPVEHLRNSRLLGNTGRFDRPESVERGAVVGTEQEYGYDDLFPEGQASAGASQVLGTPDMRATQKSLRATHQSLAATQTLGATGNLERTRGSLAETLGADAFKTLVTGNEREFKASGVNQQLHGEPNLPTGLDYGNVAQSVALGSSKVQVPVTVCSTHGFSRTPFGGFYKPKKKQDLNAPMCEVRENPRVNALLATTFPNSKGPPLRS